MTLRPRTVTSAGLNSSVPSRTPSLLRSSGGFGRSAIEAVAAAAASSGPVAPAREYEGSSNATPVATAAQHRPPLMRVIAIGIPLLSLALPWPVLAPSRLAENFQARGRSVWTSRHGQERSFARGSMVPDRPIRPE